MRDMNTNIQEIHFPHFGEKLLTVVSFAYAYIAQRVSQKINEFITQMGLDGRIDVFIIIIMFSVAFAMFSSKQKTILGLQNKIAFKTYLNKIHKLKKDFQKNLKEGSVSDGEKDWNKSQTKEDTKNGMDDEKISKLVSEYMGNISTLDQYLRWEKFIENYFDFLTMIGTFLIVGYSERFLVIMFSMLNVSVWTVVLILSPILFFLVSLKTMSTGSDIISSEIKTLVEN